MPKTSPANEGDTSTDSLQPLENQTNFTDRMMLDENKQLHLLISPKQLRSIKGLEGLKGTDGNSIREIED